MDPALLTIFTSPTTAAVQRTADATPQRRIDAPPAQSVACADQCRAALRRKFAQVASLSDGWDGPSSRAPAPALLYRVESIVALAIENAASPRLPFIVPMPDGGVQVEWHREHGSLEVAFYADGDISALFEDPRTDSEQEAEGHAAIDLLLRRARWVAEEARNGGDARTPAAPTLGVLAA